MSKIFVIGDGYIELLKQLIADETAQQLVDQFIDNPVVEQFVDNATEPDFSDFSAESDELLEDEDLPLIVQLRLPDEIELIPGLTMKKWVDANIDADDLDHYRAEFPEQEYRLVAVYDEIVEIDESVEQEVEWSSFLTAEDEIGQLKAEVLKLKALIANYENAQ